MALTTRASAVTPAVPQAPGIDHSKRFTLALSFSGLDDPEWWAVLGAAASVPAVVSDLSISQSFKLTSAARLSLQADPISGAFSGVAAFDRNGADWAAGNQLYVAFLGTGGLFDGTEPLLSVKGPFAVT